MGIGIRYRVVQNNNLDLVQEIHKVVVGRFRMSDIEDPDLWAAQSLYEWEQSEQGKFVMENAIDKPTWHRKIDYSQMGYEYIIVAELEKKKYSEFLLRFGQHGNYKS